MFTYDVLKLRAVEDVLCKGLPSSMGIVSGYLFNKLNYFTDMRI